MNTPLFVLSPPSVASASRFLGRPVAIAPERRPAPLAHRSRPITTTRVVRMVQATDERARQIIRGPYEGVYGAWNLTQGDIDGVNIYRGALLISATSAAAGIALYHTDINIVPRLADALFAVHTAAFGAALATIHIYVKPLHDLLKTLLAASLVGAAATLATNDFTIVNTVVEHPVYMLAVGWQFVALTGLFFKECMCFGRIEALGLFLLTPVITGGHFLGILNPAFLDSALTAYAGIYLFFAARKFTQLPEDDIGDMSVFQHRAKLGE